MLLEVKDMYISYNGTKAVNGISMNVSAGEAVGIIGPNGSGKSTFLKGLAGAVPLDRGTVTFAGEDITTLSPGARLRKSIVYLPQGIDVFPSLTVEENLKLFVSETPTANNSLDEAYSFYAPLGEKRKKLAGNLSGGERRLLALTRAIISKPKLLLLDEPSAGLSPAMLEMVANKIEEIAKVGVTLILVEQMMPVITRIADYLFIMNGGRVVMDLPANNFDDQKEDIYRVFLYQSFADSSYEQMEQA